MGVGSKNKKHAKESGGIAAAVTKQAAGKFVNSNLNEAGGSVSGNESSKSPPTSDASSPPAVTPEFRPSAPYNGNHVASPLLEALSTTSVSAGTPPSMMNEWARGGFGGSPGNLIQLTSDSPPTQPSSYEDSNRLHQGWAAQRHFMSPSPASLSPPNANRRPLSFQMESQYTPSETPSRAPTAAHRRSSLHSPFPHSRAGHQPPLPHQPQAHFYGAQDLGMTLTQHPSMKAGAHGYFFGFDRLPSSPDAPNVSDKVVLAGYEGGLEVYSVSKRGVERVAGLRGLRGGVHHAKILPWTVSGQAESVFPLVAVVIHGPVLPRNASDATQQDARPDPASPSHGATAQDGFHARSTPVVEAYQTSVEVYSLKTNKLVDVLLQSPKTPINSTISLTNPLFQPPPPNGEFTVKADGRTIAVCSGVTGECWIYQQLLEAQNTHLFACSGKLWTSLQQSSRGEVTQEGDKMQPPAVPPRSSPHTPILALNGRWIAYCPSSPSSQISARAHLPVPTLGRAPGVSSMTPPHLPPASSAVDLPISDSVVNKIMRETTQELIQGAKWVGQQGMQAWNSYWNKSSSPQSQQQQARSPPQHWAGTRSPHSDPAHFPPTHGASGQAGPKDPGLVSILDIDALATSASIHPLTTFATPLGCSFLSFAPSSLALFTASSKGDVQTVWDLLRIQHTQSSPLQATLPLSDSVGPQVRQIAQFSRMTVARIVDIAWSEPHGERIAMVTERGTVHLLDMPFSSFMWPAPRRRQIAPQGALESDRPTTAVSIASGAVGAAYQAAKPFVTRSRRSSANTPAVSGTTLKDSAAQGGRIIAAGISHSLGKTGTAINQLRHNGENRVSLPPGSNLPSAACVSWIKGRKTHVLFAVGGGLVRTFPCKSRQSTVQTGKRIARASRYKDHKVPLLPDDVVSLAIRQIVDLGAQEEYLDLSDADLDAGNTMTLKSRPRVVSADRSTDAAIPQAEIESSAPYQPFHTDRRVTLCEYRPGVSVQLEAVSVLLGNASIEDKAPSSKPKKMKGTQLSEVPDSRAAVDSSMWAFGQDIPAVKLELGIPSMPDEDSGGPEDYRPLPPSAMERVMEYGNAEQIVVTTRRRRTAHQGEQDGDGFFEDDCEVLDFADQRV